MTRSKHDPANHNPCHKEQEQSYECLNKNNFDQEKCSDYFDNYNICKKFWGKVYNDRKAKGLYPYLPTVEEREDIKKQFLDNGLSKKQVIQETKVKSRERVVAPKDL